jgi:hypothetical protein
MSGFPTGGSRVTGRSGVITNTGKDGEVGAFVTIDRARGIRDRN